MSPPLPPLPPSGPPNSINFSRRKLAEPRPPSPLFRLILHWSRNCIGKPQKRGTAGPFPFDFGNCRERLFGGFSRRRDRRSRGCSRGHNRNIGTAGDARVEFDGAFRCRKDRMITADADVIAWVKFGAALAHDDVARDHGLAAKFLDAEPATAAVAAVAR